MFVVQIADLASKRRAKASVRRLEAWASWATPLSDLPPDYSTMNDDIKSAHVAVHEGL